ncbi:GAF domain-containing protein [Amycolatopsis rhabdoformis]|uniref:GAF domain-containing protein n=1 Tax=Amycolatopsis rhabdoformis TaxID=1448059 RepID=A0ABZ1IGX8_9PSEU|nr:GAF domain-containing protein [Amycolatopsis rhabdoformis]WSE33721.1 GAF domain-containing protein [Amycolatopsis rhabdoformis]
MPDVDRESATLPAGPRDRLDALLTAVLGLSAGLELDGTLRRVVATAADLVDARYGALALLDADGTTTGFVVTELDHLDHASTAGRSSLAVALRARGTLLGRLYLTGKRSGGGFTEADEQALAALAAAAGIAVDNARLYEESRSRQRWLEATGEISAALLGGTEISEVLRLVASRAAGLTGAVDAVIAVPDTAGSLVVTVCEGPDADALTGRRIPVAGSTSGAVLRDHVPRSVSGLAVDLADGPRVDLGPALVVLLRSGESTAGVLLAVRAPGAARFAEQELQIVSAFADQASLALRDAENQAARRELDVVVDRDRIARDLHDHVVQRLFAVGLQMRDTLRHAGTPAVAARLGRHVDQLQEVIEEIRSAIFELHTAPGRGRGLRASLQHAITDTTGDSAIRTSVRMSGPLDRVPPVLAEHAEAVVREAVSNVLRHSRATELAVTVTFGEALVVEVTDTGVGLPPGVARSGLRNLEERAAESGGSFRVECPRAGGTRLVWTVPVRGEPTRAPGDSRRSIEDRRQAWPRAWPR